MNTDMHIAKTSDRRSKMPDLKALQISPRTDDVVHMPVKIEPLHLSAKCYTEEQAAIMLNMPSGELCHERERGAISYRLLGKYIRYTNEDLNEYLENTRINASITQSKNLHD